MARKYTKVETMVEIIAKRAQAGETYREIGASLGLSREEVRGAMHRHHAKERKIGSRIHTAVERSSTQGGCKRRNQTQQ